MKIALTKQIALIIFIFNQVNSDLLGKTCDKTLLESYDLEGSRDVLEYRNILCPTVAKNCCTYMAQLQIYKKWVINKERKKILDFYKTFVDAYTKILSTFETIEKQATLVKDNTANNAEGSNCYKISNAILIFEVSAMKKVIVRAARKAYKFLYESRRGFYCSMCNSKDQPFFNKAKSQIIVNTAFCKGLILNTMNFFLFKYSNFMKISRLYAKFLVNCNLRGEFFPNKFLKHEIQFFRKKEINMDINNCKASLTSPEAIKYCNGYCSHFNPVVYNQYFEGEVDKVYSFQINIEHLSQENQRIYEEENERAAGGNKGEEGEEEGKDKGGQKTGRLLAEKIVKKEKETKNAPEERNLADSPQMKHPDFDEEGKLDEDVNEISQFNKEFKTALIRTISYDYSSDMSLKHPIDFTQSIVGTGLDKVYELTKYKVKVEKKGIDFHTCGKAASITKGAAMRVFKNADPNKKPEDFMKFMLKGL